MWKKTPLAAMFFYRSKPFLNSTVVSRCGIAASFAYASEPVTGWLQVMLLCEHLCDAEIFIRQTLISGQDDTADWL